jgi:hypothetical protein
VSRRAWVVTVVVTLPLAGCGGGSSGRASPAVAPAAVSCPADVPLRIGARVRVGGGAGPLTVLGDTLWTARPAAGALVPVRTRGTPRAGRAVRLGGAPVSIAAGFGSVYVADRDRDRILRVSSSGDVARWAKVQAPIKVVMTPDSPFAISLDDGSLYRLAPQSPGESADIDIPATAPADAVYEAGELWIRGGAGGGLAPFNLRANGFAHRSVKLPVRVVGAIAAGRGAVWAALPTARAVARLDAATLALGVLRTSSGLRPTAIAVDDCAVWAGDADGRVERIDARTGAPGRPLRIGRSLAALVADRGGVWASDPRGGSVVRVEAR